MTDENEIKTEDPDDLYINKSTDTTSVAADDEFDFVDA